MHVNRCKLLLTEPDVVWDLVSYTIGHECQLWIDFADYVTTENELNYVFLVITCADKKNVAHWLDTFDQFGSVEHVVAVDNWDEVVGNHSSLTSMITPGLTDVVGVLRSYAKLNSERS